jgi:phenylacetate-CoA ligase
MSSISSLELRTMQRTEMLARQSVRLCELVRTTGQRNPFYAAKWKSAGVSAAEIRSCDDLHRLPFTTKSEIVADQAAHPPYGSNLASPLSEYIRLHQTSGTTGEPMRWLDTRQTWDWMLGCWAQLFTLMELEPRDRLLFAFSFGPFLGFWAGFEGSQFYGSFGLASGGMSTPARLKLIGDHGITVVCCTPTYALRLADVAAYEGIDLAASSVRALLVAGEPGGNQPATRQKLEAAWGARVFDHWGMTELGPLAIEPARQPGGLTMLETECVVEVIDPATLKPVEGNGEGELVVTNLGRVDCPLIRYRTGDRVRRVFPEQDSPWPFVHLPGGILGRVDDMLTIRGTNVYPAALEDAVRSFPEVAEFRIEVRTDRSMDELRVQVEPATGLDPASFAAMELTARIAARFKSRFNLNCPVELVPAGSLPRFEMKARRVVRVKPDE